jgi:OmpA family
MQSAIPLLVGVLLVALLTLVYSCQVEREVLETAQARAESVMRYLTSAGVDACRLSAQGYGESRPIAGNDTDEGRAENRRVEFRISL